MAEDIICNKIKESIFKNVCMIDDKNAKETFEILATNIDWSTALASLSKEVNDVCEKQHNKERSS